MNKELKTTAIEIKGFSTPMIEPCAKLYKEIFGSPPWNEYWSLEAASSLINKIAKKNQFIGYVADYNNEGVGYLLGYLWSTVFPLNQIFYINELFIEPKYQNLSIGKRLVNELINDLRKKRIPWVILLSKKDTNAEKFYKRLGFKIVLPGFCLNKRIIMGYRLLQHVKEGDNE
jgi:ribosomal protein S18 acetylase RimI-like enzyme